jgi:hypothetical protein
VNRGHDVLPMKWVAGNNRCGQPSPPNGTDALDVVPPRLFLKDDRASDPITVNVFVPEDDDPFGGIRCPLCHWRPSLSSRWRCDCGGTPEPFFAGCGMVWNTFSTHGCCPGCSHQWRWTSCLRCGQSSLHEDWYEERDGV